MYENFFKKILFKLDPELAHNFAISCLNAYQISYLDKLFKAKEVIDEVELCGLKFPNKIGLAAGFDKNAQCIDALFALGFGFIEVGSVTPLAQEGNAKPRMFRIEDYEALINRLGFNNYGLEVFYQNLLKAKFRSKYKNKVLGVNLGKNAVTPNEQAAKDYILGLVKTYNLVDFFTINISSPNTTNLRQLQEQAYLSNLLLEIINVRNELSDKYSKKVPIFLKVAPDLSLDEVKFMSEVFLENKIDGLVATNTTIQRPFIDGNNIYIEKGGLSGKPLLEISNNIIAAFRKELGKDFPIIGVGGVLSASDAVSKIQAGANLVEIYTGLIYKGLSFINECALALKV